MQHLEPFHIIGIAVRTSKENDQYAKDIPALWGRFVSENLAEQIPQKLGNEIYCAYTEYQSDHTEPYTTVLGCKVKSLAEVPEGFKGITIEGGSFEQFIAKGNLMEGAVSQAWFKIWEADIERTYATDFEVYGAKAQDPTNAEVEIFVGLK